MIQYQSLLQEILEKGERRGNRTDVDTISLFSPKSMAFDLSDGFPLLTTKKMFMKGIVGELCWFLQGRTDIKWLQDRNIHIWDSWHLEDGTIGPGYGYQLRHLPGHDQLQESIDLINNNPDSRRNLITLWNPQDVPKTALPPCHGIVIQFNVSTKGELNCHMYQRSADVFLGVGFNIASYALLVHMIAQVTDLKPGRLTMSFGDAHIYTNHLDQVHTQLGREPRSLPDLVLNPEIKNIEDFKIEDVSIENYDPWPAIKGDVAV